MASPTCTIQDGAGAPASTVNGVTVVAGDAITIALVSVAGVASWSIACIGTDEIQAAATINAGLTVNGVSKTATFTMPTAAALGFRSTVVDTNGVSSATQFGIYSLANGLRVGFVGETTEGSAAFGTSATVNAKIRQAAGGGAAPTGTGIAHVLAGAFVSPAALIVDADVATAAAIAVSKLAPGPNGQVLTTTAGVSGWAASAAGSTPTGTGLPHVVAGVQNAAASLVVDADVSATAAIAGSKISPSFGAQAIVTTGTYSSGAAPAQAGAGARLSSGDALTYRNVGGTADILAFSKDSGDGFVIGANDANQGSVHVRVPTNQFFRVEVNGATGIYAFTIGSPAAGPVANLSGLPILGDSAMPSPYGVNGVAQITPIAGATRTEAAANYAMRRLVYAAGAGLASTVTMPTPTSLGGYYEKTLENNSGFTMTFTCGAGTTRTIATGFVAVLGFYSTGDVKFASAAVAP